MSLRHKLAACPDCGAFSCPPGRCHTRSPEPVTIGDFLLPRRQPHAFAPDGNGLCATCGDARASTVHDAPVPHPAPTLSRISIDAPHTRVDTVLAALEAGGAESGAFDLDAIEAELVAARHLPQTDPRAWDHSKGIATRAMEFVDSIAPLLVAEVKRLREEIAALVAEPPSWTQRALASLMADPARVAAFNAAKLSPEAANLVAACRRGEGLAELKACFRAWLPHAASAASAWTPPPGVHPTVLLQTDAVTVAHVVIDPGAEVPREVHHNQEEALLIVDGNVSVYVAKDFRQPVHADKWTNIIPAGSPHVVRNDGGEPAELIAILRRVSASGTEPAPAPTEEA